MRRNWPFFKDSDWLILVFVHSAKPTAELENLAMSPSLSSPGLSYDTKFVHIGWELRSSLVGDTILGVQSEPACKTPRQEADIIGGGDFISPEYLFMVDDERSDLYGIIYSLYHVYLLHKPYVSAKKHLVK